MPPKKRINWTAVSGVCIGIGLLAMLGTLVFVLVGSPTRVDPGSALSEMNWVEPSAVRIGSIGTGPFGVTAPTPQPVYTGQTTPQPVRDRQITVEPLAPAVVVLAQAPGATGTSSSDVPTVPAPTATTVGATAESAPTTSDATPTTPASPEEPPPGAELGVTYCGATTCVVGFKCCCDGCVPFEQECNPRACEAQAGLSISVPCGMDLCDPGEVCCDARCGECAPSGECPEEPCN